MNFPYLHDYHFHTFLSTCSGDVSQTTARMLAFAVEHKYDSLCITDHCWDSAVPGSGDWYVPQNIEHVQGSLSLPEHSGIPFYFGCETEFCGAKKLGLAQEHFDLFDFVVIPVNHMHMFGFVRPPDIVTPIQMAELIPQRLEELLALDLPWHKIGIAHLVCELMMSNKDNSRGDMPAVIEALNEKRMMKIFDLCAKRGIGIELNSAAIHGAQALWPDKKDAMLRIYRMAKKAGCLFYCGSDAHGNEELETCPVPDIIPPIIDILDLTEKDRFYIGQRKGQ